MNSKRVLLGGIYHETHTFIEERTTWDDFAVLRGDELWRGEGDANPLAGVLEVARQANWQIVPTLDIRAMPSGTIEDAVVERWWDEFSAVAQREIKNGLDGVYLVLHGAGASASFPDLEGELLRRLRALPGFADILVCGCTDPHVNFTPAMAQYSNVLVAYRCNPHTDAKETAVRAARIMDRLLESGEKPRTFYAHAGVMWPPTGLATADDPIRTLEAMARAMENADDKILAVNVHLGYTFADTPYTGVSFSICTIGEEATAQAHLEKLVGYVRDNRESGTKLEPAIEEVMPQVKVLAARGETPILLVEPSDNIGGGSPGDCTGVLHALVRHEVDGGAVVINDPQAVKILAGLQIGEKATLPIGGKHSRLSGEPATLEVELVSRSDGNFTLEDLHSHAASMNGAHIRMGDCAVVRHHTPGGATITILLTSRKSAPMDLGQWRSQGIAPEQLKVIGVKAAVSHRQAYNPITRHSFNVATIGPCSSDMRMLPFEKVQRPIYPLDV